MAISTNDVTVGRKYLDTYRFMINQYVQLERKEHQYKSM